MKNEERGGLVKITGLWKRHDRKGNMYLGGNLSSSCSLLIFPALKENGGGEFDPDYVAYYATNRNQKNNGNANGGCVTRGADGGRRGSDGGSNPYDDDDMTTMTDADYEF